MLGSTTSRRNFSTASRSASLNPKVATSNSPHGSLSDALCGMAARSAKPHCRHAGLAGAERPMLAAAALPGPASPAPLRAGVAQG